MKYNMVDRIGRPNLDDGNRTNYLSYMIFEVVLLSITLNFINWLFFLFFQVMKDKQELR